MVSKLRRLVALTLVLTVMVTPAFSHGEWAWIQKYPGCCGEHDCFPLTRDEVTVTSESVLINATGELVPFAKIKQSEDFKWWRCGSDTATRCLFAPGSS